MTQFIYLLVGIILGAGFAFFLPIRRMAGLIRWTIFLLVFAIAICSYITYAQTPEQVAVYPDPIYLPNYFEYNDLSTQDRLLMTLEQTFKTYVYGFIGLGISFFYRGKEKLK
jgi:hypothetical protein